MKTTLRSVETHAAVHTFSVRQSLVGSSRAFSLALALLVFAALARSYLATARDGLTIDEAWHAVAAASYVQTGDFRINPEHPPLMKLWVGMALGEHAFKLPPFRPLADKEDERAYINQAFFLDNDPDRAHERARLAMLALHGALLFALGFVLRRSFGAPLALVSLGLLAIDPTVAAHLPAVLTDLPLALTSSLAVLLAIRAFRSWRATDLALASLALGLAFAAKHSGLITGAGVAVIGVLALREQRLARAGKLAAVLFGAYLVLWSSYGFRYAEGAHGETEQADGAPLFNRSLHDKLADLQSDTPRQALQLAADLRLLPRAYLWGVADIVRGAVEGRQETLYVYGQHFEGDTPWYFFPAAITAKVPLGLLGLAALGLALLRRVPERAALTAFTIWCAIFLLCLMRGNSGYAGIRHAAPVLPMLAVLGALPIVYGTRSLRYVSGACLLAALASALPVQRPWEYFNGLVGGAPNAWRSFTDDGLDNGQRTVEIADYYHAHVSPAEPAFDLYNVAEEERTARGLRFASYLDAPEGDTLRGTMFVSARWLAPRASYDFDMYRAATPVARFGNLLVYRGSFHVPWLSAARKRAALDAGLAQPEQLLREIVAQYPADMRSWFELANLLLERGDREGAARAYEGARAQATPENPLGPVLSEQLARLARGERNVPPVRNPWLE
jgi:hypothetical protein